ncbi:MAG TPA: hypothetical protein VFC78_08470 [Tepidisphaeraceae bacterium]|nr:hypothetical protein [Tepidisphaeraceae bacterium]
MKTLDMPASMDETSAIVNGLGAPAAPAPSAPAPAAPTPNVPRVTTPLAAAAAANRPGPQEQPKTWFEKAEAYISRLSMRDNFWHAIFSLIWLPLAFFSGIQMKQIDAKTFAAYLPFRRFNRNWYRAMAGGALLANSEIAGGMYVFGAVGGDYMVVCKELNYKFMRPCFGPAVYRMRSRESIPELLAARGEFNVTLDLDILQQGFRPGERDKRVGQCFAIFHVTPRAQHQRKAARKAGDGRKTAVG